jgi:glutamine kinase
LKVIIIEAGDRDRYLDTRKSSPLGISKSVEGFTSLDWIAESLRKNNISDITYAGAYHIEKVLSRFPEYSFIYSQQKTPYQIFLDAIKSINGFDQPYLFILSDSAIRSTVIEKLISNKADINFAIDTNLSWKDIPEYFNKSEKIYSDKGKIIFSQSVSEAELIGRFTGLFTLSGKAIKVIKEQKSHYNNFCLQFNHILNSDLSSNFVHIKTGWQKIYDRSQLSEFVFGTKAETLKCLSEVVKKAKILDSYYFTVSEWNDNIDAIIATIIKKYKNKKIIVRSSAIGEDSMENSQAGQYDSIGNINCSIAEITNGVDTVISSYKKKNNTRLDNQVLVQEYIETADLSGVIFTRDINTFSPYITVNYDDNTGSTDSVTSGSGDGLKTLFLFKYQKKDYYKKNSFQNHIFEIVNELEDIICYDALDIEFSISKSNTFYIFQVRPLVYNDSKKIINDEDIISELDDIYNYIKELYQKRPFIAGRTTLLGNMPDWNPAELIGVNPKPMAVSLYKYLITDHIWAESRGQMGYKNIINTPLSHQIAGHPYIDTRASFNSFIPNQIEEELSNSLVDHYINNLKNNVHLHDKVEFSITLNTWSFDFKKRSKQILKNNISTDDLSNIENAFKDHFQSLIINHGEFFKAQDLIIENLQKRRKAIESNINNDISIHNISWIVKSLLDDCRDMGVLPFSNLARCAFISTLCIDSLEAISIISKEEKEIIKSIPTIATEMSYDINKVVLKKIDLKEFLKKYGHLRPGTYDICQDRYDQAPDYYFSNIGHNKDKLKAPDIKKIKSTFMKKAKEVDLVLKSEGFLFDSEQLISFIIKSIQKRELYKFQYTKNLSLILELIALFGKKLNYDRYEMSFLSINDIIGLSTDYSSSYIRSEFKRKINFNVKRDNLMHSVMLPSLILSPRDVYGFNLDTSAPNFITIKSVTAEVALINGEKGINISNKIVMIENADPGFDWIFSYPIKGLITKYGGVASHMSIRAAEFSLPSAIGCGESLFKQLINAKKIQLNCIEKQIKIIA